MNLWTDEIVIKVEKKKENKMKELITDILAGTFLFLIVFLFFIFMFLL